MDLSTPNDKIQAIEQAHNEFSKVTVDDLNNVDQNSVEFKNKVNEFKRQDNQTTTGYVTERQRLWNACKNTIKEGCNEFLIDNTSFKYKDL